MATVPWILSAVDTVVGDWCESRRSRRCPNTFSHVFLHTHGFVPCLIPYLLLCAEALLWAVRKTGHGPSFVVYSSGTKQCQRAADALKDRKGVLWQEVLIFLPLPLSGVGEGGGEQF